MLQPEAETGTVAGAGDASGATNGAHIEGDGAGVAGAGAGLEMVAVESREEFGIGGSGGNRWPRQETLALLQIRSDMDGVFRDSSHKGLLWEDISRKMAQQGYHRSAKKCREKFENVYKYHKRTKDCRAGKGDGKAYRFFDQLQAMESTANHQSTTIESAVPIAMVMPPPPRPLTPLTLPPPPLHLIQPPIPPPIHHQTPAAAPSETPSSSSSTSSDEEITGIRRTSKKRKLNEFLERITKNVMAKQDELHTKFLEAIERRENEQRVRDEAWKIQETARLKREHEILVHERSMAEARDSALTSFLKKLSDHHRIPLPPSLLLKSQPLPPPDKPIGQSGGAVIDVGHTSQQQMILSTPVRAPQETTDVENGGSDRSSARWPKGEIEELIKLRTAMEERYQEGVAKGPLWEEISREMKSKGYNRNAKRCKEKWENINKYYRKVKESNKKPRVDSKTCPYYHHLEALYATKPLAAITAGDDQGCQEMVEKSSAEASSVDKSREI